MLSRTLTVAILIVAAGNVRAQSPVSIGVLLNFESHPAQAFVTALERELGGIMGEASFKLYWINPEHPGQSWDHSFIVKFRGSCSGASLPDTEPGVRVTLAQSVDQEGSILPYAELDCDRLRKFLHGGGEARFGRATGRLLAHELYHVLLQTREHSKTGIARAVQTPSALLSRSLRFESEDLEKFRSVR